MYLFDRLEAALNDDLDSYLGQDNPDPVSSRACDAIRRSFGKKFTGERSGVAPTKAERDASCQDRFLKRNLTCLDASFDFPNTIASMPAPYQEVLGEAQLVIGRWLQTLEDKLADPSWIRDTIASGPGVAQSACELHFYAKAFNSPAPVPSEVALYLWNYTVSRDSGLHDAELERAARHGPAYVHRGAKWSSVPKSNETNRSIVVPLNAGGLMARALGILLEESLSAIGLNIQTQPDRNRYLAFLGSIMESHASPCTIDLSDASDSIYVALVEYLFYWAPNTYKALNALRDRYIIVKGIEIPQGMFSTMGCGYTFALQTIIFAAISVAAMSVTASPTTISLSRAGGRNVKVRAWGVFGDDIVVPKSAYQLVIGVLQALRLSPNPEKSFDSGQFRESCGTDWYRGHNIRGVYCQGLPKESSKEYPYEVVSLFNRLMEWQATWVKLPRTTKVLWDAIPEKYRERVPLVEDYAAGIRVPSDLRPNHRVSQTLRIQIGAFHGSMVYRPYRPKPTSRDVSEAVGLHEVEYTVYSNQHQVGDRTRADRFRVYNSSGYLLSVVKKSVTGRNASVRSARCIYHHGDYTSTYSWDHYPVSIEIGRRGELMISHSRNLPFNLPGHPGKWSSHLTRLANLVRLFLLLEEK